MFICVYLSFEIMKQKVQLHKEGIQNRRFNISSETNKKKQLRETMKKRQF